MKKLAFYAIALLCLNCTIEYDGDTRFVVEGQLTDRNENPISNHAVQVWVHTEQEGYGSDRDLISFTRTNGFGEFKMAFPRAKGNIYYNIKMLDGSDTYQNKTVSRIKAKNFKDYTFTSDSPLTLLKTDDIAELNLTLNAINPENQIIDLSLDGILADRVIYVNPPNNPVPYYGDNYYQNVAKNQTLTVNYDVRDNNTQAINSYQETIVITNEDTLEYTIDY